MTAKKPICQTHKSFVFPCLFSSISRRLYAAFHIEICAVIKPPTQRDLMLKYVFKSILADGGIWRTAFSVWHRLNGSGL